MNRALLFVLGTVAVVCMAAATAQASVLMDWDMEGTGAPAVGTVSYTGPTPPTTCFFGVVSGGGAEPAAYEGSNMVKCIRTTDGPINANLDFERVSGDTSDITASLAVRVNTGGVGGVLAGTTGIAGNIGSFMFDASGVVKYLDYSSGGSLSWLTTGLSHHLNQWNTVSLAHTNGTGDWTLTVNGSSADVSFTRGDYFPSYLDAVGGLKLNVSAGSTVYFDSISVSEVPEPHMIVMLCIGIFGLLAYAWRRRK